MYFKQIDEIVTGTKTQTRRMCKPGEYVEYDVAQGNKYYTTVFTPASRLKWQVGRDYAVSPGRGKPGVWWTELLDGTREWQQNRPGELNNWRPLRIRITEIRREPLQDISEADAIAEGYKRGRWGDPQVWYHELWENINGAGSWAKNPDVWVLTFKVVRP